MADAEKPEAPSDEVNRWLGLISTYDTTFKKWQGRVERILKRYRDEHRSAERSTDSARLNILWSNTQTLKAATFSKLPKPDVSRRFRDNDPVGRVASLILERALDYEIQHYPDYRETMTAGVLDRFLGGRGTSWVRYEPHFKDQQQPEGVDVTEDEEPPEELDYECAPVDYVHWKDFGHVVARTWAEVPAGWRKVYMTREACVERFGEDLGNKIPLDATPEELKRVKDQTDTDVSRACVYEIADKEGKCALWLSKSMKEVLDKRDDPWGVEGFFPFPKPLFATLTNDSLIPVPDFALYQDQANELDMLMERIDGLIQALQVKGGYDASVPELARIFTEANNGTLIPIKNWAAFAEKNGLTGSLSLVDLRPFVEALKACYEAVSQIISFIYQVTGISDIVRGETDPNETLGAQELKGQYASLRLKTYQQEVAQFATEILQLKAQLICNKFAPETIAAIAAVDQLSDADKQLVTQALLLLLGQRAADPNAEPEANPLRNFRVEIAADSLVYLDEQAEKQSRVEFLTAVGAFMEKAAQVGAVAPQLIPLIMTLLKFGVTGFRVGKTIEGEIDQAIEQMKQAAAMPKPPPPPDPRLQAAQATAQSKIVQAQTEMQTAPIRADAEKTKAVAGAIAAHHSLQNAQLQAAMPPQ